MKAELNHFKAGGAGENTGEMGRGDPLGSDTVWISLFREPSVGWGKGKTRWSQGEESQEGRTRVM